MRGGWVWWLLSSIDKDIEKIIGYQNLVLRLHMPALIVADVTSGFDLNGAEFLVVLVRDRYVHIRSPIGSQGSYPTTAQ